MVSYTIFDDLWEVTKDLPRRQGEQFLYAVTAYAIDGVEPDFRGELWRLFTAYRYRLDASAAASAKGRAMAAARYAKQERQQAAAADATAGATAGVLREGKERRGKGRSDGGAAPAPNRATPPTPDEVRAYSEEQGLGLDPERFCDYYAAQGWRLSNGRAMKDWRAAARNWARRDGTAKAPAPAPEDRFSRFDRPLRVVGGEE